MPSGRMLLGLPNAAFSSCFQAFPEVSLNRSRHQVLPYPLIPCALPKLWIQDLFQQLNRASSLLSPSLVAPNGECLRVTSMQPTSLVEKLNRHQGAVLCYV